MESIIRKELKKYYNKSSDFIINDFTTIKNFKIISEKEYSFLKFGETYNYLKFEGTINNQKVKGFVCLKDKNIYKLEKIEK